jgi:hypothetical protein
MAYDELEEAHIFLFLFPKLRVAGSDSVSRSILPPTGCAFVSSDPNWISHALSTSAAVAHIGPV